MSRRRPRSTSTTTRSAANSTSAHPQTFLVRSNAEAGVNLGLSVDGGPNTESPIDATGTDTTRRWANVRWRHSGNTIANVLYADGHAGSLHHKSQLRTELLLRNIVVPQP